MRELGPESNCYDARFAIFYKSNELDFYQNILIIILPPGLYSNVL